LKVWDWKIIITQQPIFTYKNKLQTMAQIKNIDGEILIDRPDLENFRGFNFSEMELPEAQFCGMDLTDADFSLCYLRDANFEGADLSNCYFLHSDCRGSNFKSTVRIGANFCGANVHDTVLEEESSYIPVVC